MPHRDSNNETPLMKAVTIHILAGCLAWGITTVASAQTTRTVRVVCYNLEADIDGDTAPLPGLIAPSSGGNVTNGGVLEGIGEENLGGDPAQPIDILALEETTSNTATVQPIVNGLNTFYSFHNIPAGYAMSTYQATDSGGADDGDGPNALVYNTNTVQLLASVPVDPPGGTSQLGSASGEYREVMRYEFAPAGLTPTTTNEFYLYVSHYKALQDVTDENYRQGEAAIIRTNAATLPNNARILYVGDYNVSSNTEPAFQTIVAPGINQGFDPLNPTNFVPERWDLNSMLNVKSEEDTSLHWRFDIQIMTSNVFYGVGSGLALVSGTYHIFGNNGSVPYLNSVDDGSDTALNNDLTTNVTGITATQLYEYLTTASDHLPCVADYTVPVPVAASFTANPLSGAAPLMVNFTDTSVGTPTSWAWTFGDGGSSTNQNPSYTYVTAGTWMACLIVSNAGGASSPFARTITVWMPPQASFTASPTNGSAPLAVTFVDNSTGVITNRFWNFGDGATTNITTAGVAHTYAAGTDTVTLVVSGPNGASTNTQPNCIVAVVTNTVSASSSPSPGGTISGSGTYTNGSTVTLCATANSCYSFVNWTDQNSNVVSTSACYTFSLVTNETLVAIFAVSSLPANSSLTNLWIFTNGLDGANPYDGLVQGSDGNFYGTTYGTGSGPSANGTVFKISPGGVLTSLWSFTGGNDGANPQAGLVQGSDSNFYGTTAWGGASGYGTVFRISPSGSLTNLWEFTGGNDGANPMAGLVQGIDSNFYGTTPYGGATGNGTVFRTTPSGSLSNLWSFTGGNDGANPMAGLLQGGDGNFYGTTYGSGSGPSAYGTVFRISPSGSLTSLWSFTGGNDGSYPWAALVQGSDSNFYGTASYGGAYGAGTAFRISPGGSLTNLWSFTGGNDGATPQAGLVLGIDSNFYGTTSSGGASGSGTVFRISPSGNLTNLWSFTGCADGANPMAGLVQGSDSNFYGTTYGSGNGPSTYGTVFKFSVSSPLPPVAMFTANPTSGAALLTVTFTDTSSNSPTSWTWTDTYGDMSTNENPMFTYANPGTYTVQLIACNAVGCGTNAAVINVYSPFAWWQLNYFGTTNNYGNTAPTADYTGTGMSNTNKFMAGFNPLNPAAYLHIISVDQTNNTNIVVTYLGASGDTNWSPGVQFRTNVLDFTTGGSSGSYTNGGWQDTGQTNVLGVGISVSGGEGTGLGTVTNMTDVGGATKSTTRYYRVRVLLP